MTFAGVSESYRVQHLQSARKWFGWDFDFGLRKAPGSAGGWLPGSISWISAYIAQSTGVGGVYLTFLKSYEKINEVYEQLLSERENIEREVAASLNWERIGNKIYIAVPNISTGNLDSLPDRQRVIQYLAEMTNKMVNAFRHRLDAMTRK